MKPGRYTVIAETVGVQGVRYTPTQSRFKVRVSHKKATRAVVRYLAAPTPAPDPVAGLAVAQRSLTSAQLTWLSPADASSIAVRRSEGTAAPSGPDAGTTVPVIGAAALDTGLQPGTAYSYAVFAVDGAGRASAAATLTVTTVDVQNISAGSSHTCAVLDTREIQCWGDNSFGQLGNGTTGGPSSAVTVVGISTATAVSAGESHTCALLVDLTVKCWGAGTNGQLGNNGTQDSSTPVPVALGAEQAYTLSSGSGFTCASVYGGRVWCWGLGNAGQMGNGTSTATNPVPVQVTGVTTATEVSAGLGSSACARLGGGAAGQVKCWGYNSDGQLGVGFPPANQLSPVSVTNLLDATSVRVAMRHACATTAAGSVRCWGLNDVGELGNGATSVPSFTPTSTGLTDVTQLSAAGFTTCARRSDAKVWCWGLNLEGQVGDGTTTDTATPLAVSALADATSVSVGYQHSCATRTRRLPVCWGDNGQQQLGDGSATDSSVPVAVTTLH